MPAVRLSPFDHTDAGLRKQATKSNLMNSIHSLPLMLGLVVYAIVSTTPALAQDSPKPSAKAVYLTTVPVLDGVVDGDPAWRDVDPLSSFQQHMPNQGVPATLHTEVRLGYTDDALHVSFIAYEDDINDMNISSNGWQSDSVMMVIDPHRSGLSGFAFATNQTGVEWDASTFNGNSNWNWSTVWEVKAKINEEHWSVEMVIPFTSLQYPRGDVQSWGFNFERYVKGRNELSHWAPIPRQFSVLRLALAGTIENIRPPPSKRNVKFNPYLITAQGEGRDAHLVDRTDYGFDILYSLTPTLNLTATVNTDFAQVESDRLQINTGRFSLFFPETRPFFLENEQLFNVGVPGETLVFHSRRIGIGKSGSRLPMDGGIKLAGYLGSQSEIGLMSLRVDSEAGEEHEIFNVARYSRTLPNRSKFGLLATHRDSQTHQSHAIATDLQWGIGEHGEIRSFIALSDSNDDIKRDDEYTYALYANYNTPDWQSSASYHEVGAGFNPSIGFVQRPNSRKIHLFGQRSLKMNGKWGLHEWKPHANYTAYWDFDGYKESSYLHVDSWFIWKSGADIWTALNFSEEGVRNPFYIAGEQVLVGEYKATELSIGTNSPQDRAWGIGGVVNIGGFYQGDRIGSGIWSNYTVNKHLNFSLNYNFNRVDFPNLDAPFDFSLASISIYTAFTPKITLASLLQYNDANDILSANLRFAWLRSASTGLYLVYNEIDDRSSEEASPRRSIVLKYSHMFDMNL